MVSSVILCIVTKNKSLNATTLHTAMNLHMYCMSKGINLEVQFVQDRSNIQKFMKSSERLIWIDYGVTIGIETLEIFMTPFPENVKALVVPCVLEGVDWELFKKKTLENSDEPAHQRGLRFDTEVAKKNITSNVAEFVSSTSDGRVFVFDNKPILKKLRDADTHFKSFEQLKKLGVKIGVLRSCSATCHYVYECFGNILESTGVVHTQ